MTLTVEIFALKLEADCPVAVLGEVTGGLREHVRNWYADGVERRQPEKRSSAEIGEQVIYKTKTGQGLYGRTVNTICWLL